MGKPQRSVRVLAAGVLEPGVNGLNLMAAVKAVADTAEAEVTGLSEASFAPVATGLPGTAMHTGHRAVSGDYRIAFSADAGDADAFRRRLEQGLRALVLQGRDIGFAWISARVEE